MPNPDRRKRDQDSDAIHAKIQPLRFVVINECLGDLDRTCEGKDAERSQGRLRTVFAQQQRSGGGEPKQHRMDQEMARAPPGPLPTHRLERQYRKSEDPGCACPA